MKRLSKYFSIFAILSLTLFSFNNCGNLFRVSSPPVTPASSESSFSSEGDSLALGKTMYEQKCAKCHGGIGVSTKLGKTAIDIANALKNITSMSSLKLSDLQIRLIAQALNPSYNNGSDLFACKPNSDPSAAFLSRMTRTEYTNSVNMIFGAVEASKGTSVSSLIASELRNIPFENDDTGYDNIDPLVTQGHVDAYLEVSKKLGSVIVGNSALMSQFLGNCSLSDSTFDRSCMQKFISTYGMMLFRRPLTTEELNKWLNVFEAVGVSRKKVGFQLVLIGLMQSPHFLYKIENEGGQLKSNLLQLNDFEVASRLSFMFWGRGPDYELLKAAQDGKLSTSVGLEEQAKRLLADAKAKTHLHHFYSQWLKLEEISNAPSSANFLKGIASDAFRQNALKELEDYVDYHVLTKPSSYKELMTANIAFPKTSDIAAVYGAAVNVMGAPQLASNHKGLLARSALLLHDSTYSRPILRSVRIRNRILCDSIPLPDLTDADPELTAPMSPDPLLGNRLATEARTSSAVCMSCHSQINPLGFAFEGFDSIGRPRTMEEIFDSKGVKIGQAPVNTKSVGNLVGQEISISSEVDVINAIAESQRGPACFTTHWYRFANGKAETMDDNCMLNAMAKTLSSPNKTIQDMLLETIKHPHFRQRKLIFDP